MLRQGSRSHRQSGDMASWASTSPSLPCLCPIFPLSIPQFTPCNQHILHPALLLRENFIFTHEHGIKAIFYLLQGNWQYDTSLLVEWDTMSMPTSQDGFRQISVFALDLLVQVLHTLQASLLYGVHMHKHQTVYSGGFIVKVPSSPHFLCDLNKSWVWANLVEASVLSSLLFRC